MNRQILPFDQAYDVIAPYLELYIQCVRKGFADYVKINEFKNSLDVYSDFEIRTRANIIHDRICGHITDKFRSLPRVTVGEWNRVFAIKFADLIFLRNKKFKSNGKISNYYTIQHKAFLRQSLIDGFPNEPTFVIGGYIPNDTYTDLKGIYIGCWSADGLEWFTKVGEYSVEQGRLVFPEFKEKETKRRTKIKDQSEQGTSKKRTRLKGNHKGDNSGKTGSGNV